MPAVSTPVEPITVHITGVTAGLARWDAATAEPPAGSCTRLTFGGTSGAVTSMRIFPASRSRKASAVARCAANGTDNTTMACAAASAWLAST